MIYSNELPNMKLLRKRFRFPINPKDRKHGMAVTLLTPNIHSSASLINGQNKFIDPTYFESYYFDKSVSYLINDNTMTECSLISDTYTTQYDLDSSLNEFFGKEMQKKIIFNGPDYDIDLARQVISIEHLENINTKWFKENLQYPISVTIYPSIVSDLPENTSSSINLKSSRSVGENKFVKLCYEGMISVILKTINPDVPKLIISAYTDIIMNDELDTSINKNKDYVFTIKKFLEKEYGHSMMVQCIRTNDYSKLGYHSIDVIYNKYKPLFEGKMDDGSRIKRNITTSLRRGSNHIIDKVAEGETTAEAPTDTVQAAQVPAQTVGNNIPVQQPPTMDNDVAAQLTAAKEAKDKVEVSESYNMNEVGIDSLNDYVKINDCFITILDEVTSESTINQRLKNILYRDRIRANKDMYKIYDEVQQSAPNIKYTYTNYKRYKNLNMFIDLSYYNSLYFENSGFTKTAGIDLYFALISRMMKVAQDNNYSNNTVIIPVNDWDINPDTRMWMYTEDINPVSLIYHMMKKDISLLREVFADMELIFISDKAYFKMDLEELESKDSATFLKLIKRIRVGNITAKDAESDGDSIKKDSTSVITDEILNTIEKNDNIIVHRLTGNDKRKIEKKDKNRSTDNVKKVTQVSSKDIEDKEISRDKVSDKIEIEKSVDDTVKEKIAMKVEEVAEKSNTTQEAIDSLENDEEFRKLYQQLESSTDGDRGPIINASRSSRMTQVNNEFLKKKVNGNTVESIIDRSVNYSHEELPEMAINVESMNDGWKHLTYASINRIYDPNDDIIAGIYSLSQMTYPIAIRDIKTTDISTSEDALMEYRVECENHLGKRFTLNFVVPILVDNLYMRLHGNIKNIEGQSTLMPILKTESDTVQMISNYKKIFFRVYGSTVGKTNVYADKLVKTLSKHTFSDIEIVEGDNSLIANQYELPIDYIDLSRVYSRIIIHGKNQTTVTIFFNQYEIRNNYKVDDGKGIPYAAVENGKTKTTDILYYNNNGMMAKYLVDTISSYNAEFLEAFNKQTRSTKYSYSEASIMSVKIPIVVITCYHVGLTKTLDLLGVKYEIREKTPTKAELWNNNQDIIKFDGGCIVFEETPESSLLMNGLKVCDTEDTPLANINSKNTYLQFLDQFGGRIKADGLDNFYDCMIDPITKVILGQLKLPTDYVELLIYANNLLIDNKYNIHGDMSVRRIRRNELIPAYTIQCLYMAYGQYANQLKHGRDMTMTIKRTAVVDAILSDNTVGDVSIINNLNEYSCYNTVSPRGIAGMNSDRSYSLDKRTYDESMINILSLSTGFASTVGIPRQATIDANISTVRGFAKPPKKEEMGSIKTMSMTEAVSTYMSTRDDTFRTAMTDGQTTKHSVRCEKYMPALISNGADQALPLLSSNIFSFKAKYDGKVKTLTDDYMILEYKNGLCDYINLQNRSEKNSSTGIYISLKLDTELKEGQTFKAGHIVAQDNKSLKHSSGFSNNFAYSYGVLAKCAFMVTDECFEDSAIVTEALSDALTTDIIKEKEIALDKNTNVYGMPQIGDEVKEGQVLMTIQTPYDDADANDLISKLSADGDGVVSDLGKIPIKSKVTGWIHDIKIMRTCEIDELSPSLKKIVTAYEKKINDTRKVLEQNGINSKSLLPATYKLEPVGSLKDTPDGVKIIIRMGYRDKFGIGDKLIYMNANKGVDKHIIPRGLEPYSLDRPDEKIHIIGSYISHDARMVTSNLHVAVINRLNIECARRIKDKLKIPYNVNIIE